MTEALLKHTKRLKQEAIRSRVIESSRIAINNYQKVINKYYTLTDQVLNIYFIASVLNPTLHLQQFKDQQKSPSLKSTLNKHKKILTINQKRDYSTRPITTTITSSTPHKRSFLDTFLRHDEEVNIDELTTYLRDPITQVHEGESLDLFKQWNSHKKEYPTLSQIAFDILSIPSMSIEYERVFLGIGALITHHKKRILEDIIEAIECLQSQWYQKLIIQVESDDKVSNDKEGGEGIK